MDETTIGKVIDLAQELTEIAQKSKFYVTIDARENPNVLVLKTEDFFKLFNNFDIRTTTVLERPWQVYSELDGVEFNTMLTPEEYEEFVLKSA